jgi:hypothetical protein
MATRFRTQDTKASWARKLNTLFGAGLTPMLRETPQTQYQWCRQLNAAVTWAQANGFAVDVATLFRLSDPRTLWARKLNGLATAIEAGAARTVAISAIATDNVVSDAEAASVVISGTSVGLANGTVVSVAIDGVALATATVTDNAWATAAQNLTALANGSHVVTAKSPTSATGSRTITRAD